MREDGKAIIHFYYLSGSNLLGGEDQTMCELAFMSPDDKSIANTMNLLRDMYNKNDDGLGIIAIYRVGDTFEYDVLKAHNPQWVQVLRFVSEHQDAWRFAIHARLATVGGVGHEQAHPISVDCGKCSISMVMHNGVIYNDHLIRQRKDRIGHDFTTTVDTEVIAHHHRDIPEEIEDVDEPDFKGRLNYFLFTEDKILIRAGYSYHLDATPKIAKKKRGIVNGAGVKTKWLLVTPNGETQITDASRGNGGRVIYYGSGSRGYGTGEYGTATDGGEEACEDGCEDETPQAGVWSVPFRGGLTDEEYAEYEQAAETYSERPPDCMCGVNSQYTCGPCYEAGFRTINPEVKADIYQTQGYF